MTWDDWAKPGMRIERALYASSPEYAFPKRSPSTVSKDATILDYSPIDRYQKLSVPKEKVKMWLDEAKEITTSDRRRDYGHPLPNFIRIALGWIPVLGSVITPLQVAQAMVSMKMARDVNTYKDDNWIDTIGYSNTVQMMDTRMKEMGFDTGIQYFGTLAQDDLAAALVSVLQEHDKLFPKGS